MKIAKGIAFLLALCLALACLSALATGKSDFDIVDGVLEKYNGYSRNVTVPEGVTAIGEHAFIASDVVSVTLPKGVTKIGLGAFYCCSHLERVALPEGLTTIAMSAFTGCNVLGPITIPSSVTSIGKDAFELCYSVVLQGTAGSTAERYAKANDLPFLLADTEDSFTISSGVLTKYTGAGGAVVIPKGVKAIGKKAFFECADLITVDFPDTVTEIRDSAFENCTALKKVNLPEGLKQIGGNAFCGCESLKKVDIPESVTVIDFFAFGGCSNLSEFNMPSRLKTLGNDVFYGCTRLQSVVLPEGITIIDNGVFSFCSSLEEMTIPSTVTKLYDEAFRECTKLALLYIPETVLEISDYAIDECPNVTIYGAPGSAAEAYALAHDIPFVAEGGQLPTEEPTEAPTAAPTEAPTAAPTEAPTAAPTEAPTAAPTEAPTVAPTEAPTAAPTEAPTAAPTEAPTEAPTAAPTEAPTEAPTAVPTEAPTAAPTEVPTAVPTEKPTATPTFEPTAIPTVEPTAAPTPEPTVVPTEEPTPKPAEKVKISKCKLSVKDQTYTGKAIKPDVTVKYGKAKLEKGTDYTVTYKNNKKIGVATAVVKGKGKYTGTAKTTFTINPQGTAFTELTGGNKSLTLKWERPKNIKGYELQYSLKKSFAGKKTVKIKKAKTLATTLKKLKAGKKYYVRIRTYATAKKKTYYSAWSKAKTVKTAPAKANSGLSEQDVEPTVYGDDLSSFAADEVFGEDPTLDAEIELLE